jgi:Ni,Fe-hydrogenase I small subunit
MATTASALGASRSIQSQVGIGCPVQPDNFMETLLYLLYQVAGLAPMIPLDDQLRPKWLFGKTVHEGCILLLRPSGLLGRRVRVA